MTGSKHKSDKKEQKWMIAFAMLPVALLFPLGELFAESGTDKILIQALLGGLGGMIGFGFYMLLKKKSAAVKISVLASILIIGLVFIREVSLQMKPDLLTCEVCGYKTFQEGDKRCKYCGSLNWGSAKSSSDYTTKEQWLRDEQLYWFGEENVNEVRFYEPSGDQGFKKDPDWKPVISAEEAVEDYDRN